MAESSLGRNRVFQIKNDDGTPFHNLVLHKATYDSVVMSLGDKITGDVYYKDNKLDVTMNEYIEFARDPDDSSEEPVKFILVNPPTIVKEGIVSDNSELKGMTKYSFEFYHPMCKLGNMPLTDIAVTQDEERYLSQNKTFSWCGTGNDFIAKLNANLYYSEWIVVASENEQSAQRLAMMPSEVPTKKAGEQAKSNVLSFDKNTIADGLKTIYETWDIPFVVDALHQGEYYDADGHDYYSEEGGNKRFVVIVGMPSNEIIDTESEFGVVVNATQLTNGDIYYGGQPISVQKGKKIVLQSLTDGAMPMILNSNHNGVIGTTSKTFETDMTIYVGLYPKSGYVKYFYNGDGDNVFVFRYGQGVGLKNNSRTPRNNKIITRISASGSENNIPYGYPQIQWTGSKDDPRLKYPLYKGIVGGQYVTLIKHPFTRTRLMPSVYVESVNKKVNPNHPLYDPDTELVDYYDADSTYENPIIASSPSYEIHEFDGIKPELDSDRQIAIQGAIPLNDDLTPADSWVDDLKPDTDEYAQSYFRITLPPLGFDVYACASITQQMQINMRSGACIGCTFEIQVDWDDYKANFYDSDGNFDPAIGQGHPRDAQKYPNSTSSSINVVVKKEISTFGTLMPNIYQQPKSGDLFVILGISLPQIYITNAQQRLDALAKQYMRENNTYYFDYPLKFDEYFLAKYPSILRQIRTNTIIRFDYAGQTLHLCVKQITIKFGEKQLPQYNITLTDNIDVVINPVTQVASDVSRISSIVAKNEKSNKGGGGGSGDAQDKLSRLIDDTANGIITFAKGIKIGLQQIFGWSDNGDIVANDINARDINAKDINASGNGAFAGDVEVVGQMKVDAVKSHNYTGDGIADTGYRLTTDDGTGSSALTVDNLHVRKKATFEELEVKKETAIAGNQIFSSAANIITRTDYFDINGKILGYSYTKVPWLLKGFSMVLGRRITQEFVNFNMFGRQERIRVTIPSEDVDKIHVIRCYFLAKDGEREISNMWKGGSTDGNDLARCQTMNLVNSQRQTYISNVYESKAGNVFWWRKVVGVSTETVQIDGAEYHYIDLSWDDCADGSDIPAAGDHVVQFGNDSNPDRMNLLMLEINGSDAPCVKALRGVFTYSLSNCYWGGVPQKMKLSPATGYEFFGPDFMFVQEYGQKPASIDRGLWTDIPFETDEMDNPNPHYSDDDKTHRQAGQVRKCYYYDKVSHKGCYWLCVHTQVGVHYVCNHAFSSYNVGDVISKSVWDTLSSLEKSYFTVTRDYTIDEPDTSSPSWQKQVDRGTSVKTVEVMYAKSDQGVIPPPRIPHETYPQDSDWVRTIEELNLQDGDYLWTRTKTEYSDTLQPTISYSVSRWGIDGDGIAAIDSYYLGTSNVNHSINEENDNHTHSSYPTWMPKEDGYDTADSQHKWYNTFNEMANANGGLGAMQGWNVWQKTIIHYDVDSVKPDKDMLVSYQCNRIGQDGQIGEEEYYMLAASNDFATVFGSNTPDYAHIGIRWYNQSSPASERYRLSDTEPNINTAMWSPIRPTYDKDTHGNKIYLWNFEQSVDGMGTEYATRPICIGNHARGIFGIQELYACSSSSVPESGRQYPSDISDSGTGIGVWTDEAYDRAPTEERPYQWNKTVTIYIDSYGTKNGVRKKASDWASDKDGVVWDESSCDVICHVSAVRGTNGEDGAGEESIYITSTTPITEWGNASSAHPHPKNIMKDKDGVVRTADYISKTDDFVPYGWSDNPVGIDETNKYEYVSTRKLGAKDSQGRKTWQLFGDPVLRSNWGKNGVDGDGVEYVFIRTNTDVAPTIVNSADSRRDSHNRTYLDDEYLPLATGGGLGTSQVECTDDPVGADENHKFEWVAKRTKGTPSTSDNNYGKREWEKYSGNMSLFSNFAESVTKISEEYRYKVTDDGTTTPTGTWYNTRAAAEAAYPWTANRWMWVEITINWSDGSNTTLYTNERNPNDGKAGQDIIVDGATEMKYYVGDSNTTHPSESSSDWKDISQVVQTQGKWLWSKATTYYRKASSAAGSKDAGYSVNYNVSYISKDGKTGRGIQSITEYYQATNSNAARPKPSSASGWDSDPNLSHLTNKWDANHRFLWNMEETVYINVDGTTSTEYNIPQILAIWTKDGDNGRGIDSIVNYYLVSSSSSITRPSEAVDGMDWTPPSGSQWDDNPTAPAQGEYLWNFEKITWILPDGSYTWTYTDAQNIGYAGTNGAKGDNGDDSVTYDIVLTEAWAKRDNSANRVVTGRLSGRAYRITGDTWTAISGETIQFGYQSGSYGSTTTNSSGYFTSNDWFEDQWSGGTVNQSTCIYATLKVDGVSVCTKYVTIVFDGDNGQQGSTGRMFYTAGEWKSTETYTRTDTVCPIVEYNGDYWYLDKDSSRGNTPSSSSTYWKKVDQFGVVFTEALFTMFGKLGGFVVAGDYFISQYGTLYTSRYEQVVNNTTGSTGNANHYYGVMVVGQYDVITEDSTAGNGRAKAYTYFDASDPAVSTRVQNTLKFKPALCINAVTGYMHTASGNFVVDASGNVTSNNMTANNINAVSGTFNGTVKAQLFYAATKKITSNYTINLETEPYYTYFKEQTYNTSYIVTLPNPSSYDGVELRFFSPVVGSSGNVMRVYYSGGINLCLDTGVSSVLYVAVKPFKMGTLKAIDGKWWTIDDGFVQGGS